MENGEGRIKDEGWSGTLEKIKDGGLGWKKQD